MSWLPVLGVAALAFVAAALLLRLPKSGYTLLGATLLFGLAGYALQGSPGAPAAPGRATAQTDPRSGELLVAARREFFAGAVLPSRFVITSDAYARRGDQQRAAAFAESAVEENPSDIEAWVALGNALTEHAGGQLTPAAIFAYSEAARRAPTAPAPGYFLGFGMLRSGEPERARQIWAELLGSLPSGSPWRAVVADRLARLDSLLRDAAP